MTGRPLYIAGLALKIKRTITLLVHWCRRVKLRWELENNRIRAGICQYCIGFPGLLTQHGAGTWVGGGGWRGVMCARRAPNAPCQPHPHPSSLLKWNALCGASYLTLWDMCSGVSISSKMAPLTLEPRRLASCRSQPDRSQFCR